MSYAHLDGHENFEDVPSKNKRSSDDADTDNTAGPSVARPDRRHKISELSTEFELEGAITATDMTSASEKSRDVSLHLTSATLVRNRSASCSKFRASSWIPRKIFAHFSRVFEFNFRLTHKFSVLSTDTGFENLIQATDMTALTSFSSTTSSSTVVGEGTVKEVKDFVATKVRSLT